VKNNTLQTLDRGLRILELLCKNEMGPSELSRTLRLDRANVHRQLHTLVERGFVEKVGTNGRYRANQRHLQTLAGISGNAQQKNWIALAQTYLEELSKSTEQSANLCVPSGTEMVYLLRVLGNNDLAVNMPPGTKRPLYCSAVGKAYLGALPEEELDLLLKKLDMQPITSRTITSPAKLKEHLKKYREHGYVVDDGEYDLRISCLAAPVFDSTGRPIASIGVSGPREDASSKQFARLGAIIAEKANALSQAIGYIGEVRKKR